MPTSSGLPRKKCFVISPIGNLGTRARTIADDLLARLIRPALEPEGFDANRVDQLRASWIHAQLVREIQSADLVVAVLTETEPGKTNANVYWELGIANALCKAVVPIASAGTPLPFDISHLNTIFYPADPVSGLLDSPSLADSIVGLREHVRDMDMAGAESPFRPVLKEVSGRYALTAVYVGKVCVLDLFRELIEDIQREIRKDNKMTGVLRPKEPMALTRIGVMLEKLANSFSAHCQGLHLVVRVAAVDEALRSECLKWCDPMNEIRDRACRLADWLQEAGQNQTLTEADIETVRREVENMLNDVARLRLEVYNRSIAP